jgi:hypothetical protein
MTSTNSSQQHLLLNNTIARPLLYQNFQMLLPKIFKLQDLLNDGMIVR